MKRKRSVGPGRERAARCGVRRLQATLVLAAAVIVGLAPTAGAISTPKRTMALSASRITAGQYLTVTGTRGPDLVDQPALGPWTGVRVAQADSPPSGAPAQAVSLLNLRYRRPLGLPDVLWDSGLARAAQNHADYWAKGNAFGHTETPGTPGFTGVSPSDRCQAVGARSCGEVAFPQLTLVDAVAGWMNTPLHGRGLIASISIGCGQSISGSNCNLHGGAPNIDQPPVASSPVNAADSPVRIWPFAGAKDVPVSWWGGEIPDPLVNYVGDRHNVGPTLFFFVESPSARITMTDASGRSVPLIFPFAAKALPYLSVPTLAGQTRGWYQAFPGRVLAARAAYTLSVQTADGVVRSVTFTTQSNADSDSGGLGGPVVTQCVVPRLIHLTLTQAKAALARAHCVLGSVQRPKKVARNHTLRVVKQSLSTGRERPKGARVSVVLA